MPEPFPRISGRKGAVIRLNASFFSNGQPADPYSIRRIDIYQNTATLENLVAQIDVVDPDDPTYPNPLVQVGSTETNPGEYYYDFAIPDTFEAPDSYIDKWYFIGDELLAGQGSAIDLTDETLWDSQCNDFFIVASNTWYVDDGLIVPRYGFEALDKDFTRGEVRTLEVGIMPLPLYDYDYNRIAPMMAMLVPSITIESMNCEVIVSDAAMTMGIRQGSHRSNPFVAQYKLDTTANGLRIGTYRYTVTLTLPNGETRISSPLVFSIR